MEKSDQSKPTCGVIIKRGFKDDVCTVPAVDLVTLVDPEDRTTIKATLLVCEKHSKDLDNGKKLIFIAEGKDGKPAERISIQFGSKQKQ